METTRRKPARELEVLRDPGRAAALLDPDRRRLVAALRESSDSASGLARRLGDSRQRLNYHLRALEDAGIVELQEERRRGNCVERVLRVAARRFVLDPAALDDAGGGDDARAAGDRFSAAYLVALAARVIREVAALQEKAGREEKRLATAGLAAEVRLGGPGELGAFVEDLSAAVAAVVARHHDDDPRGRPFRVVVGAHPAPEPNRPGATNPGGDRE